MKKIMVGSPICQDVEILREFLISLNELIKDNVEVNYCFVDDNNDQGSSELLEEFKVNKNVKILKFNLNNGHYHCDESTHRWNNSLIDRVTFFKNTIIDEFLKTDNEYLFFIDSDIVLDRRTLQRLIEADKDIIANIFWTRWNVNSREEPQVWMKDFYTLYEQESDPNGVYTEAFINMLRTPGIYRVGGLGACTLIKRKPLEAGVNFSKIRNISFWGEDRAFCIRAEVMGFDLYVDTRQPAFHIYRKSYLSNLEEFKNNCEENIKYDIYKVAIDVIKELETFDYRSENIFLLGTCFNKEMAYKIESEVNNKRSDEKVNNVIKKVTINNISSEFINSNCLEVTINIISDGYRNWRSFSEGYIIKIGMEKEEEIWKISKYEKNLDITFKSNIIVRSISKNNRLTLSMSVRNEEGRYLEDNLKEHKKYIDSAVIIDDGSTDRTVEIVKDILGDCDLTLIENEKSMFYNEVELRKKQWIETIKTKPDWILSLDSDEIFEHAFSDGVKELINSNLDMDGYSFRLYDFWGEDYYREDEYWYAHKVYRLFLVRYQENFKYLWNETNQHCGRLPYNCYSLPNALSSYRLKHLGWSKKEDREAKFKRYIELDKNGRFGNINQYYSILDENPNVVNWIE